MCLVYVCTVRLETLVSRNFDEFGNFSPKFNQSIYPNKCFFYEDVKQFTKVYVVSTVCCNEDSLSFSLPKFPVLRYIPYKRNIWRTLYLANEGKNRIGERLNWRSTL